MAPQSSEFPCSFDPETLHTLAGILTEIETEFAAKGRPFDDSEKLEVSHRIMNAASRGIIDRSSVKECALNGHKPNGK